MKHIKHKKPRYVYKLNGVLNAISLAKMYNQFV